MCRTLSDRRRDFLTFDSQHIPSGSLDIHAVLCCEHGRVCKSHAREHVTKFR